MTFRRDGFNQRVIKSITLSEREQKRIPDVALDLGICGGLSPDLVLLAPGVPFGRLTGSVTPSVAGVEVTLVCRTFSSCRSTKTDSKGSFSFDMLSTGVYGLNFRREGYYPVDATGYLYTVNVGWEVLYGSILLERCPNGNCDPKLRPQRPIRLCE